VFCVLLKGAGPARLGEFSVVSELLEWSRKNWYCFYVLDSFDAPNFVLWLVDADGNDKRPLMQGHGEPRHCSRVCPKNMGHYGGLRLLPDLRINFFRFVFSIFGQSS